MKTVSHNIRIQMSLKELTKTFMMISNWKKSFGLHGLNKNSAFEGLIDFYTCFYTIVFSVLDEKKIKM